MTTATRVGRAASENDRKQDDASVASPAKRLDARTVRAARRPPRYFTLNGAAMVSIAAVALSVIGILYLIQTAKVAGLGYELSDLQTKHDQLAIDNADLGYKIAKYQSLDAVNQIATQKLGMVPLTKDKFLDVQAPAGAQLPTPPAPSPPRLSLLQRIERAIGGVGSAEAPSKGPSALPTATPEVGKGP